MRTLAAILAIGLMAGCGGKGSPTTPAAGPARKLPLEVTGSPEDALPKQPARIKR